MTIIVDCVANLHAPLPQLMINANPFLARTEEVLLQEEPPQ
jgi:hypothetical protein